MGGDTQIDVNASTHKHVHTLGGIGWVLLFVLLVIAGMLGMDISDRHSYTQKIEDSNRELSRLQALERNHHDDARDELKVAEMLAAKLEARCRL